MRRALTDPGATGNLPAAMVQPAGGELIWWMDEGAASDLEGALVPGFRWYQDGRRYNE